MTGELPAHETWLLATKIYREKIRNFTEFDANVLYNFPTKLSYSNIYSVTHSLSDHDYPSKN